MSIFWQFKYIYTHTKEYMLFWYLVASLGTCSSEMKLRYLKIAYKSLFNEKSAQHSENVNSELMILFGLISQGGV